MKASIDERAPTKANTVIAATKSGDLELLTDLLEQGNSVSARDCTNRTPLHIAAANGTLQIAKLLLEYGADVHSVDERYTPLEIAVNAGHEDLAALLRFTARVQSHSRRLHHAQARTR